MTRGKTLKRGLAALVVSTLALSQLTGCGLFGGKDKGEKKLDQGVTISGNSKDLPKDPYAKKAAPNVPQPPFKQMTAATDTLEIGPSGAYKPMVIKFTLAKPVPQDSAVVVATNFTHQPNGWQLVPQPATISQDRLQVQVTVDHLSWFKVLIAPIGEMVKELKQTFIDGMSSGVTAQGSQPSCSDKAGALSDGYSISSSSGNAAFWCFGKEGSRTIRFDNNRRYPLELRLSGMRVKSAGKGSLDLAELARIGHAIVMPHDTAVLTVNDLKVGDKATLDTSLSATAMGLQVVQVLADTVLTLALKTNVGAALSQLQLTDKALQLKDCIGALGDPTDVGKFVNACFDEKLLAESFGWRAAILSPVMAAFALINVGQAVANAYGDSKNGRSAYNITVKRGQPSALVGRWVNTDDTLVINPNLQGTLDYLGIWGDPGVSTRLHYDITYSGSGNSLKGSISSPSCFTGPPGNTHPSNRTSCMPDFPGRGMTFRVSLTGSSQVKITWDTPDWVDDRPLSRG